MLLKGYASLAAPLVALTTLDKFQWSAEAQAAFDNLKCALSEAPVLALLDFSLPFTVEQRNAILQHPLSHPHFSITNNLILHKSRIWVPRGFPMIPTLITKYHCTSTGGHMGIAKTLARITENFYW